MKKLTACKDCKNLKRYHEAGKEAIFVCGLYVEEIKAFCPFYGEYYPLRSVATRELIQINTDGHCKDFKEKE